MYCSNYFFLGPVRPLPLIFELSDVIFAIKIAQFIIYIVYYVNHLHILQQSLQFSYNIYSSLFIISENTLEFLFHGFDFNFSFFCQKSSFQISQLEKKLNIQMVLQL